MSQVLVKTRHRAFSAAVSVAALLLVFQSVSTQDMEGLVETDSDAPAGDEDVDADLKEPELLLYVPFDGSTDGFTPGWIEKSLARRNRAPLPQAFAPGIVGKALAGGEGAIYPIHGCIRPEAGSLSLWFHWDAGRKEGNFGSFISFDVLPIGPGHDGLKSIRGDGRWHHILAVWEREKTSLRLFLDGKLVSEETLAKAFFRAPPLDENGKPLPVSHALSVGVGLPGLLDEVYIWDYPLDEPTARAAYERGMKGLTSWPAEKLPRPRVWRAEAALRSAGVTRPALKGLSPPSLPPEETPGHATRHRYSLNGIWRCQPVGWTEYVPTSTSTSKAFFAQRAQLAEWGVLPDSWMLVSVPGDWRLKGDPPPRWFGSALDGYDAAWFEREVEVPAAWKGQAVYLGIHGGVSGEPTFVFVNSKCVGELFGDEAFPLELSDALDCGKSNRLSLLVGNPEFPNSAAAGNVWLLMHDARGPLLGHTLVTPQEGPESLDCTLEIQSHAQEEKVVELEALVWPDSHPDAERVSLGRPKISLTPNSERWYPFSVRFPHPHRWNPEDAFLYGLVVRVYSEDGRLLDESTPVRFGFRTFAAAGRDILLNGKPVHLRGMSHNGGGPANGGFEFKKKIGLNADRNLAGYMPEHDDAWLSECDEAGWLQCYHVNFNFYWRDSQDASERDFFWRKMRLLWNHPSLVAWFVWGNGYVPGPHGHPRQIGATPGVDYEPDLPEVKKAYAARDEYHRYLPGRLFFFYRLGLGGDVRGIMHYMGWGIPLQAREEWPRYWAEHCGEPFLLAEGDLPMFFNDLLWQWGRGFNKELVAGSNAAAEHAARYFGEEAYQDLSLNFAKTQDLMDHFKSFKEKPKAEWGPEAAPQDPLKGQEAGQQKRGDGKLETSELKIEEKKGQNVPGQSPDPTPETSEGQWSAASSEEGSGDVAFVPEFVPPVRTRLKALAMRRVLSSWRVWGMSYLVHVCLKPDELRGEGPRGLNALGEVAARYNHPLLFILAGPPEDFTRKDHAFTSGEKVQKQILVRNDHFSPVQVKTRWRVHDLDSGEEITQGEAAFDVDVGALHRQTVEFAAPAARTKRRLRLSAAGTVQERPLPEENFDLQVFPEQAAFRPAAARVGLIDTVGHTAKLLGQMGQPFIRLDEGGGLPPLDLLVIGRCTYSQALLERLKGMRFSEKVRQGMNVLCFEQTQRWVMGLLVEHFDLRNAFIRRGRSPLFDGLSSEDLADWRGASDLIDAYPDWDRTRDYTQGNFSKHGMGNEFGQGRFYHWSNNGMVSTYCIHKPQVGNNQVMMDAGFDLLYTPLLEQRLGRGRILFCQLDVTNRYGTDPVASRLVERLLLHYSKPVPGPERSLQYLGNEQGRQFLEDLGYAPETVGGPEDPLDAGAVLALDLRAFDAMPFQQKLEEFVKAGGILVVLPFSKSDSTRALPVRIQRRDRQVHLTRHVAEEPLFEGLAISDFFWRRALPMTTLDCDSPGSWVADSGALARIPCQKGQIVFCQIDPRVFEWGWQSGKATRIWTTLLGNLGVVSRFEFDPFKEGTETQGLVYRQPTLPFDPDAHVVW
ncbi:MAG: hypothetical protein HYU36_14490 [Planctomycetes bacterium]|nr:hypothetical protein [Planctomycetota bacterium]